MLSAWPVRQAAPTHSAIAPDPLRNALHECPDCGLLQWLQPLARRAVARCRRCRAVLARGRADPLGRALPLSVSGLPLFIVATEFNFISLDLFGLVRDSRLISGPEQLEAQGLWELAVVV